MKKVDTFPRLLEAEDIPNIVAAFEELGWDKTAEQYERYLLDQAFGERDVYIAFVNEEFAGYLTVCWKSSYEAFREKDIPEIIDFNVLPKFRRLGIGTQLMDIAEDAISNVSPVAGIGVGVDPDYGAAQRLYVLRGYVPDGRGLHYRDHYVKRSEEHTSELQSRVD